MIKNLNDTSFSFCLFQTNHYHLQLFLKHVIKFKLDLTLNLHGKNYCNRIIKLLDKIDE